MFVFTSVYFVFYSPEDFHPPGLFADALSGTSAFSLLLMPLRLPVGATPARIGSFAPPPPALTHSPPPSVWFILLTFPLQTLIEGRAAKRNMSELLRSDGIPVQRGAPRSPVGPVEKEGSAKIRHE